MIHPTNGVSDPPVRGSDVDRMDEAAHELTKVLQEEDLRDAVLLVLANKQELVVAGPWWILPAGGPFTITRHELHLPCINPPETSLIGIIKQPSGYPGIIVGCFIFFSVTVTCQTCVFGDFPDVSRNQDDKRIAGAWCVVAFYPKA